MNLNEQEYNPILGIFFTPYPHNLNWGIDNINFARDEDLIKEELVLPKSQIINFDYPATPKKSHECLQLVPALTCMKSTLAESENDHNSEIEFNNENADFVDQILCKNEDLDR